MVTRDYVCDINKGDGNQAPVLSIYGGKLTTYRELAERAVDKLRPFFPNMGAHWSQNKPLPGGDFAPDGKDTLLQKFAALYPWIPTGQRERMVQSYGTHATDLVGVAQSVSDLGQHFGAGLYENEVEYLFAHEFAHTADDILWRRSKLGLRLTEKEQAALQEYCDARRKH